MMVAITDAVNDPSKLNVKDIMLQSFLRMAEYGGQRTPPVVIGIIGRACVVTEAMGDVPSTDEKLGTRAHRVVDCGRMRNAKPGEVRR